MVSATEATIALALGPDRFRISGHSAGRDIAAEYGEPMHRSIAGFLDAVRASDPGRVYCTPADALQLRNHLIDAIEAAHQVDDPVERQEWLTFVVGGAGDTGIELAKIVERLGRDARELNVEDARIGDRAGAVQLLGHQLLRPAQQPHHAHGRARPHLDVRVHEIVDRRALLRRVDRDVAADG